LSQECSYSVSSFVRRVVTQVSVHKCFYFKTLGNGLSKVPAKERKKQLLAVFIIFISKLPFF